MGKRVALFCFGLLLALPIQAAEIEIVPGGAGMPTEIRVVGEFRAGDGERFLNEIVDVPEGFVILEGPGGDLESGLAIGRAIRLKNFKTVVRDDTRCSSACALAWLGGRERYIARSGIVGFHAAYRLEDAGPRERGLPNALVGAYLNWLGLTRSAVICVTGAPPESMVWITFENADECGIEAKLWEPRVPLEEVGPRPSFPPSARAEAGRAIYYYQGAEGQPGEALDGTVSWAEITKDGQPAIRAMIRIPKNEAEVTVTIYKNYDATLPASQMVEIQFSGSLGDSPIQRVPALVLKQTEQARGQPLAGASVPVTNNYFWIALSDDDEQASRNVQLLREGSWFDVPILFNDQTRALFTFEKGIPGDKVFEAVTSGWEAKPEPITSECDGIAAQVAGADRCLHPKDYFKDCNECPEMAVLPAGIYLMGSPVDEQARDYTEGPRHMVTITKPFAVGKFEVTFAEWGACVSDGGCQHRPNDAGWGRGDRPVINVSWDDAKTYLAWLAKRTGEGYRLLSEAEWEYAARAQTMTPFSTGQTISADQANFNGDFTYAGGRKGIYRQKTVAVGSFDANAFGLYDMHGNAWEWVEDCYHPRYNGAPTNGSAWPTSYCTRRVVRGGSWGVTPANLRSANRYASLPVVRSPQIGFRVARTLEAAQIVDRQ